MQAVVQKAEKVVKARPPVKWAGGKSQLLAQFQELYPSTDIKLYMEPFLGGGAVFFDICPQRAVLLDNNPELVNFYNVLKYGLEALVADLKKHRNEDYYFYEVRAMDPEKLSPAERASRFLFLNKTAYNGLWRVNKKGQHNVPFGKYKNPRILDEGNLSAVSSTLRNAEILERDFECVVQYAEPGSFVYLDPPYHPLSSTSNFTSYTASPFGAEDQERLAKVFQKLDRQGCLVMLSNSDTPFIRELYKEYLIDQVFARRLINCQGEKRGFISELVVRNYEQ